jgi:hypothetical protein
VGRYAHRHCMLLCTTFTRVTVNHRAQLPPFMTEYQTLSALTLVYHLSRATGFYDKAIHETRSSLCIALFVRFRHRA